MKLSEFRDLIKEEVKKILSEVNVNNSIVATILVSKHAKGHNVISVHYWDNTRYAKDYMRIRKDRDDFVKVLVNSKDVDRKVTEFQKEYNVKDKNVFKYTKYDPNFEPFNDDY
jgi:hypothetical protein